jgi:hypothetical protein
MFERISFRCPDCRCRLRASLHFVGRSCPCPQCGRSVVVPPSAPPEEAPLIILDEGFRRPRRNVIF